MKALYKNYLTTLERAPKDNKYTRRRREREKGTESLLYKIMMRTSQVYGKNWNLELRELKNT